MNISMKTPCARLVPCWRNVLFVVSNLWYLWWTDTYFTDRSADVSPRTIAESHDGADQLSDAVENKSYRSETPDKQ